MMWQYEVVLRYKDTKGNYERTILRFALHVVRYGRMRVRTTYLGVGKGFDLECIFEDESGSFDFSNHAGFGGVDDLTQPSATVFRKSSCQKDVQPRARLFLRN